jgi:hypothetical protein
MPGNIGGLASFPEYEAWQDFILGFSLSAKVPELVARIFERAQKLYLLGWLDLDLVSAGELTALTGLELALRIRFLEEIQTKRVHSSFRALIKHLVEEDGLTDRELPMARRCGATVVANLVARDQRNIAQVRNEKAHAMIGGTAFESGLLELVRDLIDYINREQPGPVDGR